VVSDVSAVALAKAQALGHVIRSTPLGESRYALELPLAPPPEQILAGLVAEGAVLVSLNPLRDTLEDVFVRQVSGASHARGMERT
jgi:hypothetical protein